MYKNIIAGLKRLNASLDSPSSPAYKRIALRVILGMLLVTNVIFATARFWVPNLPAQELASNIGVALVLFLMLSFLSGALTMIVGAVMRTKSVAGTGLVLLGLALGGFCAGTCFGVWTFVGLAVLLALA